MFGETLTLLNHKEILLSSMIQEQQKNGTAWFSVELIFEWCEDAMVFRAFVFILFRSNGKTNTWLRTILVTVMVIISKMPP